MNLSSLFYFQIKKILEIIFSAEENKKPALYMSTVLYIQYTRANYSDHSFLLFVN